MSFVFEERLSDVPLVEKVWRTETDQAGKFISLAATQMEMVLMQHEGEIRFTVRGPETQASVAESPGDATFFGIIFKMGTYMPYLPGIQLVNVQHNLPEASRQSVWLQGAAWQLPDFENADTFIERLVHQGLLALEPVVDAALQGHVPDLSLRSVQRRFLHATGLTHAAIHQIQRARYAASLLEKGTPILDTVELAGYADQPHMNRSFKRLIGQTPAQIARATTAISIL